MGRTEEEEEEEEDNEAPGFLGLTPNREAALGHQGHVAFFSFLFFHLHIIPAINPIDKLELSSTDMFTREVHL